MTQRNGDTIGIIFADYSKELPLSGGGIHLEYLTAITTMLTFIFGGSTIFTQTRLKRLQQSIGLGQHYNKTCTTPIQKTKLDISEPEEQSVIFIPPDLII